ncbi:MAG: 4Fe-4S binding protein [Rhizobiaceae bacterium]|nr:4Fe-4S binding protein [Rhizobiaceae bacterium]
MLGRAFRFACFWLAAVWCAAASAEPLARAEIEPFIMPPYSLGEPVNEKGVWSLLNSGGAEAGYVFETAPMAPLPGFSGAPINLLVILDREGKFIDVRLINHNEPIFVSGLGEAPFLKFLEQYRGHSINTPMVVGTPYGEGAKGSNLVYLDGVTKATASVRIAHESVLAAALQVAREKMQGVSAAPPAFPNLAHDEAMDWNTLAAQGIVARQTLTNRAVDAAFKGTKWADDDPEAADEPDGLYLDLHVLDVGPPSIARAVFDAETLKDIERFRALSPHDELLLVIDAGRHGLVSENFVRNTAPDLLDAEQDGLPVALRDADMLFTLNDGVPEGTAMILRADRRLGFDPSRPWTLKVKAARAHGMFQPEIGSVDFTVHIKTPERFFSRPEITEPTPAWLDAVNNRRGDLIVLTLGLLALTLALLARQSALAGAPLFTPLRLGILAAVTGFVGWWGQGQLSIVTVLGVIRTAWEGGSFGFLAYDPFSLVVWVFAIGGFVLFGRALFCGWLCPFGAMQEFAHHLGRLLRLPKLEPNAVWDHRLKGVKYLLLAGLVATVFIAPDRVDAVAEIEPFKTAVTTHFQREWWFVAYAVFWLVLGMVTFKGFCRYVCPLGAVMAIGGMVRARSFIPRRAECGSPCQLCKVKCNYGAIKQNGAVTYSECFGCLDCVTIHEDPKTCVPEVLKGKRAARAQANGLRPVVSWPGGLQPVPREPAE